LLQAVGVPQGEGPMAAASEGSGEAVARAFEGRANAALQAAPPYGDWMTRLLSG